MDSFTEKSTKGVPFKRVRAGKETLTDVDQEFRKTNGHSRLSLRERCVSRDTFAERKATMPDFGNSNTDVSEVYEKAKAKEIRQPELLASPATAIISFVLPVPSLCGRFDTRSFRLVKKRRLRIGSPVRLAKGLGFFSSRDTRR